MISATDFRLNEVLASAFISGGEVRPNLVLKHVLANWGDVYDGDPISLPLPADAPDEIPRLILPSRDQAFRLEVTRSRINLVWTSRAEEVSGLDEALTIFADRLPSIAENVGITIGRLGVVVSRVLEQAEPGRALAQQFCRDEWLEGPLNRPEGFELHAHKVFPLLSDMSVRVNSWVRIKTAKTTAGQYNCVLVVQDLNTVAEEIDQHRFTKEQVGSWFKAATIEFEKILEQYFPSTRS